MMVRVHTSSHSRLRSQCQVDLLRPYFDHTPVQVRTRLLRSMWPKTFAEEVSEHGRTHIVRARSATGSEQRVCIQHVRMSDCVQSIMPMHLCIRQTVDRTIDVVARAFFSRSRQSFIFWYDAHDTLACVFFYMICVFSLRWWTFTAQSC